MHKTSGTYAVFKGNGAAKFTLMRPRHGEPRKLRSGEMAEGFVTKNGAVLLEAAPTAGKRPDGLPNVDWDRKITFAIGVPDVAQLLDPKTEKLVHKTDTTTKTLAFQPGEGKYAGTYNMYLSAYEGNNRQNVHVPFSAGEFAVLQRLLVSALPAMLSW